MRLPPGGSSLLLVGAHCWTLGGSLHHIENGGAFITSRTSTGCTAPGSLDTRGRCHALGFGGYRDRGRPEIVAPEPNVRSGLRSIGDHAAAAGTGDRIGGGPPRLYRSRGLESRVAGPCRTPGRNALGRPTGLFDVAGRAGCHTPDMGGERRGTGPGVPAGGTWLCGWGLWRRRRAMIR